VRSSDTVTECNCGTPILRWPTKTASEPDLIVENLNWKNDAGYCFLSEFRETGSHQLSPTDIAVIFRRHATSKFVFKSSVCNPQAPNCAGYRVSDVFGYLREFY
jgi:hypothetical protein